MENDDLVEGPQITATDIAEREKKAAPLRNPLVEAMLDREIAMLRLLGLTNENQTQKR